MMNYTTYTQLTMDSISITPTHSSIQVNRHTTDLQHKEICIQQKDVTIAEVQIISSIYHTLELLLILLATTNY